MTWFDSLPPLTRFRARLAMRVMPREMRQVVAAGLRSYRTRSLMVQLIEADAAGDIAGMDQAQAALTELGVTARKLSNDDD